MGAPATSPEMARGSRIAVARRWWRPIFAFVAIGLIAAIVITVCWLLLMQEAALADAQAILITIVTALGTPLAVFIGGRSLEKVKGVTDDPATRIRADPTGDWDGLDDPAGYPMAASPDPVSGD